MDYQRLEDLGASSAEQRAAWDWVLDVPGVQDPQVVEGGPGADPAAVVEALPAGGDGLLPTPGAAPRGGSRWGRGRGFGSAPGGRLGCSRLSMASGGGGVSGASSRRGPGGSPRGRFGPSGGIRRRPDEPPGGASGGPFGSFGFIGSSPGVDGIPTPMRFSREQVDETWVKAGGRDCWIYAAIDPDTGRNRICGAVLRARW